MDLLDKKLDYWEHQLLDLGKRNKMINYRETKRSTLKLIEPDFNEFYQRIAVNEEELTFQRPVDKDTDVRVYSILSLLEQLSAPIPVSVGDIKADGSILERQQTLKTMRAKSRLASEEQGTNILYLSFGFLEWHSGKGANTQLVRSPLVLVPVVLSLESLNSPYTLEKHEDDIVLNPTLVYYLKTEFGVELPSFDADKDDIDEFFLELEDVADQRGWRIVREVSLGLLSFLKITMYNDLLLNRKRIKENPVIKAMSGDGDQINNIPGYLKDFDLDAIKPRDCYQIMSADSSQQEAILYSKNGISFVMQGPPGTGKSQTIANIIAEAIGDGKKVLFVSEKMAALQVVYKRLQECHISDFCLPLHSYKANKKDILEQIGSNLKLKQTVVNDTAVNSLEELSIIRQALNDYATELHNEISSMNISCYDAYTQIMELGDVSTFPFSLPDILKVTRAGFQEYLNAVNDYSLSIKRLNCKVKSNPWDGLRAKSSGYEYNDKMRAALSSVYKSLSDLSSAIFELVGNDTFGDKLSYNSLESFIDILEKIISLPEIPDFWYEEEHIEEYIDIADQGKTLYSDYLNYRNIIETIFTTDIYDFDCVEWRNKILDIADKLKTTKLAAEYFIDKRAEILDDFQRLNKCFVDLDAAYTVINNALNVENKCVPENITKTENFLSLIKDIGSIPHSWGYNDIKNVSIALEEAEFLSKQIIKNKKQILANWNDSLASKTIIDDYLRILYENFDIFDRIEKQRQEITADRNKLCSTNLFKGIDGFVISKNRQSIIEDLMNVCETIECIQKDFTYMNGLFGTDYAISFTNAELFAKAADILESDTVFPISWFKSDFNDIFDLFTEAKENFNNANTIKSELLLDWEKEIFDLDYMPILLRYKTDYTNILKIFSKQYKADRKTIQALSRVAIKAPKDDLVLAVLSKLKRYSELLDWFSDNQNKLISAFSSHYNEKDTKWEEIEKVIELRKQLVSLLNNQALLKYYSDRSRDDMELGETLKDVSARCIKNFMYINTIFSKWNMTINFTQLSDDIIGELSETICCLKKIDLETNSISELLSNIIGSIETVNAEVIQDYILSPINEEEVAGHIEAVSLYYNNLHQLNSKSESYLNLLGSKYSGLNSYWECIRKDINTFKAILELFSEDIPPIIHNIMFSGNEDALEQLKSSVITINRCYETIETCIDGKKYNIKVDKDKIDPKKYVKSTSKTIEQLTQLKKQADLIAPYLINYNETFVNIGNAIDNYELYLKQINKIKNKSGKYKKIFGFLYRADSTDWDTIISLLKSFIPIKNYTYYDSLIPLLRSRSEREHEICSTLSVIKEAYDSMKIDYEWISQQFSDDYPFDDVKVSLLDGSDLKKLTYKMEGCLNSIGEMDSWIDYQESKEKCISIGLSDFINKVESKEMYQNIDKVFTKGFYNMWIEAVTNQLSSVRRFRKDKHDEMIKRFVSLDDAQQIIAQMRIREKIIEGLPSENRMLRANDEVAILSRELGKKRKIMPLRKLFRQIPNLLMRLKPCLMMSPLSVSYFLESEAYHFDMVIFDEASQIFPEDAIGAIYRGAQVVIAGDSKQLPPTNFFSAATNNTDSDFDNDEDDYEEVVSGSILEEAAVSLPNTTLLWHYRSRHEGLISFSNREIYKNNLITFPNNITRSKDMGVEYIYVENGYYEGGGKNRNIREAQKCVMLVLDHIQHNPNRSLGIIAFSEKQQNAIENAITEFRQKMPQYEWFFDESKEEPFFVKNLENVQGDERDTIIFSICYAKDKTGRMYMRFGPLGHDGGERRLNVAITRAKYNIKLVGSILPSDIDLSKTNSEGVRMLRSYIDYAMKGSNVLRPIKNEFPFENNDKFCDVIEEFLVKNGYKVVRNVGTSDYKIDLAVKHPDIDEMFIAGVECDGLSYKKAKTARDRDHLRGTILRNMGWNMYRVWSTEWYRNEKSERDALLSFIKSSLDSVNKIDSVNNTNKKNTEIKYDEISRETDRNISGQTDVNPYKFQFYRESDWTQAYHSGSRDNVTRIAENINHVLSIEEPIHMELLYKRLGPSFTAGKATESVKSTIRNVINKKLGNSVVIDKDNFIRTVPFKKIQVRIPRPYDTPRPMEYIHTEEVAEAMKVIIANSFGISEEDLSSECARIFGFERKGPKIKVKTDAAINFLVSKKIIRIIDGKVQLIGEQ